MITARTRHGGHKWMMSLRPTELQRYAEWSAVACKLRSVHEVLRAQRCCPILMRIAVLLPQRQLATDRLIHKTSWYTQCRGRRSTCN
eukprot:2058983-Alexandrium_andersonii.AAC.1